MKISLDKYLAESFIDENEIYKKDVRDSDNNVIAIKGKDYSAAEFRKIVKQFPEVSNYYSKDVIDVAKAISKKYKLRFVYTIGRQEWNYGGHVTVTARLAGFDQSKSPIVLHSGRASRSQYYNFEFPFKGLWISDSGWLFSDRSVSGYGNIYDMSIMNTTPKTIGQISMVLDAYEKKHGSPFNQREAVKALKKHSVARSRASKMWNTWENGKKGQRFDNAYTRAKEYGRKFGIEMRRPKVNHDEKEIHLYNNSPRELRHPDEYGERAYKMLDSKDYNRYEVAFSKCMQYLEDIAKKMGYNFVASA